MDSIEKRLNAMESRLVRIEASLKLPNQTETPKNKNSNSIPRVSKTQMQSSINLKSGSWLGFIAVICFVLAAGFIVKLSIQSGWLTHERQIFLAALFGITLIGAGFALMRTDRSYASLLPGAGIIVLYLTNFAAHRYYSLISFETAMALTGLVSGACVWLYTKIKHEAYAITAAAGAYLAPVVLGLNSDALFSLYYFLLCSVAFSIISVWVKSRELTLVSSYLAIFMTGFIGIDLKQDVLVAVILATHFLVFSVGTYFYAIKNKSPLSETESWSFLPVLLIFYAIEYYLINRIYPGFAPWISLFFAGFLITLYLSAKKLFPDGLGSKTLVFAFATIVAFHSIYLELLPKDVQTWLFVLIMFGFVFLPINLAKKQINNSLFIPLLAILAILAIEYLTILSHLINGYSIKWLFISFASFASIWFVLTSSKSKVIEQKNYGNTLLAAAHLLGVVGLYRLTNDIGSLAVSASWLFYAVSVISFAFVRKDEVMAKSALFVLAFAAGKALLYDASSAPTVVRIFCLLITGAVLYGCGLLMRKIEAWSKKK